MKRQSADTPEEIERLQLEGLRRMSPARKLQLVGELNRTVTLLALTGLKQRYPGDSEPQRRRRLADILLGEDLALEVYGPMPE